MRKVIMWNVVSLDGFFEGAKSWDLGWHDSIWGEELERLSIDQLKSADMLLFGRATYEGMASYWSSAKGEVADLMNQIRKVVFSRTLEKPPGTTPSPSKGMPRRKAPNSRDNPVRNLSTSGGGIFFRN